MSISPKFGFSPAEGGIAKPAVFKATPTLPAVRVLEAQDERGRMQRRFDFDSALRHANEQKKTIAPNPACDYLIKEKSLPGGLAWDLLFRTGTLVAYGPSDGKYIRVPVQEGADFRIYLIPHPPEYLSASGFQKRRQLVFANHGFEKDDQPVIQIHRDGWYRVLEFSKPERLHYLATSSFGHEVWGYLNGSLSGIPTLDIGLERRVVMRLGEGASFVGLVARFTHSNDYVEYALHLSLSPLEKIPVLVYDAQVPAVESFVSGQYYSGQY